MILALVLTTFMAPQMAEAGQDSACAARHFVCLRECTKDMTKSQRECEKEENCGPLSQCDRSRPNRAGMGSLQPQGLEKCDEDLSRRTAECDKKSNAVESLKCAQEALREYRRCTAGMRGRNQAPKPVR